MMIKQAITKIQDAIVGLLEGCIRGLRAAIRGVKWFF